ncbi:peptidase S41 [Desulfosarcina alkanivorans]|uniref:Peptidase S41 n=2 Tax=Desulfosarcina alkanivorans TaxID=571177 RepID=A0A5K7YF40_9BACT|nr:peptidase S41 [Desulfosarcina alkanivorans]
MVWKTVNESHFDPTFGGIDWKAMRDRYHPQIVSSSGIEDFNRITNNMLFELRLSHLLVATEKMLKTYMPTLFSEGTVGIDVRWMQNKVVITKINPGCPAQKAGLKTGYEIKEIDGRDVNEIIQIAEVLPPYNVRNRRGGISNFIIGHLNGPPNTLVSIRYVDENSLLKEAAILRQSRGTGKIISDAMPPVFIEFEAKRLERNIGYIWFNHFADPVDKDFVQALEIMRDTCGLIFDLRSNPGGNFRVVDTIIEQLITAKTPLYRFRFREKTVERSLNPSKHPYEKPVVVLIDVTSMSSSEHFAACLKAIGRAAIVGERSPGYLLGSKWIKLPNGLSFMHSFLQPIPFDGQIVEGHGIKPDLEIGLNRNDLLKGRDNQLEAAIEYILEENLQ